MSDANLIELDSSCGGRRILPEPALDGLDPRAEAIAGLHSCLRATERGVETAGAAAYQVFPVSLRVASLHRSTPEERREQECFWISSLYLIELTTEARIAEGRLILRSHTSSDPLLAPEDAAYFELTRMASPSRLAPVQANPRLPPRGGSR